jgi:hypothetical protein
MYELICPVKNASIYSMYYSWQVWDRGLRYNFSGAYVYSLYLTRDTGIRKNKWAQLS